MKTSRFEEQQRCYCAVTVGAVAAVGSVAIAGASAYESNKNQQAQTAALSKQPRTVAANFEQPSDAYNDYIQQYQDNQPYLQSIVDQSNSTNNAKFQQQLAATSPAALASISTQGSVANDLLNGRIPADVQNQVQRSSAYQALMGQGSTDSGSAHALTARDLGTTSLALQQQGSNLLSQNLANAKAVNPYDATSDSLMLTPQQLLSRSDSMNAYQAALQNKNNNIGFQNSLAASAANSYNPGLAAVSSGVGALSGVANSGTALNTLSNYASSGNPYGVTGGATLGPANSYTGSYSNQIASSGYYSPYLNSALYDANGNYVGGS